MLDLVVVKMNILMPLMPVLYEGVELEKDAQLKLSHSQPNNLAITLRGTQILGKISLSQDMTNYSP